ncbi:MAG TPA: AAA family ATPase [Dermatophilaceae bacterium]|nr:AAA family ATPase [Dermatophilaceae bacterium]
MVEVRVATGIGWQPGVAPSGPGEPGGFVGRGQEMAALGEELSLAAAGQARVVLVQGEAGVGKSLLVRRFLATLPDPAGSLRVVHAVGDQLEAGMPYAVLGQLWPGLGLGTGAARVPAPTEAGALLLSTIWGDAEPDGEPNGEQDREHGCEPGGERGRGLQVVVIDDAHCADEASLRALLFALRRMRLDPVLLILAARPAGAGVLLETVDRLVADDQGRILRLGAMTPVEIGQLARVVTGADLPAAAARRLWQHTAGNPLHATALLHELPTASLVDTSQPLPAPRSFAELVRARLGQCASPTRRLVAALAVLGMEARLADAADLADLTDCAGLACAVDDAVLHHLLEHRPDWTIAFTHPLVRAAVEAGMDAVQRIDLHRRAAERAAHRGEDEATELRHRVAASPTPDPALAHRLERFARAEAARFAHPSAARAFLDAFDQGGRVNQALLLDSADQYLQAADIGPADRSLARCTQHTPRATYLRGWVAQAKGQLQDAQHLLERAWHDAADDPLVRSLAARQLARVGIVRGKSEDAVTWGRKLLATAVPGQRSSAGMLILGLCQSGRIAEARATISKLPGVTGGAVADTEETYARATALIIDDDLVGAVNEFTSLLRSLHQSAFQELAIAALGWVSEANYRLGRWDEAMASGFGALARAEDAGHYWFVEQYRSIAAAVPARRGLWDLAESEVATAERRGKAFGGLAVPYAAVAAARLAHSHGDYERIIAVTEPLWQLPALSGTFQPGVFDWRPLRTEALVRVGRYDDAQAALARLIDDAEVVSHRSTLAAAHRVRGLLAAAQHQPDTAENAFATALAIGEQLPMPFELAYTQLCHGEVLRRHGQRRRATTTLERAMATFTQLDAQPFLERTARELTACGRHTTTPGESALTRLTPQELAVARLVATGRRNKDTAAELVLSIKTVEYHLRNVYTKLGIGSRTQLVPLVLRPSETAPDFPALASVDAVQA